MSRRKSGKTQKVAYRLRRRKFQISQLHLQHPPVAGEEEKGGDDLLSSTAFLQNRLTVAENIARRTQERVDELKKRVEELEPALEKKTAEAEQREAAFQEAKKVVEDAKGQVQRTIAEMDNLRRRQRKEKEDLQKNAAEDLLRRLFPVVDNFNVAVASVEQGADSENLLRGIVMIHRELKGILEQSGFTEIPALGQPFDPHIHEGANTAVDPQQPDGVVLQVVRPGYRLNDKVLRPAMVVVNKLPAEEKKAEPATPEPTSAEPPPTEREPGRSGFDPLEHARQMLETQNDEEK